MRRRGARVPGAIGRALTAGAIVMLLIGACSSGTSPTATLGGSAAAPVGSAAGPVAPDRIKKAGTVAWCVDVAFPPFESYAADGTTPEGVDIDIAAEIARRWGVTSEVRATSWDALLPTLRGNGCDFVISGMTSTYAKRTEQADFVDYLRSWTAFVVAAGNPMGIHTVDDLAGKTVAAEPGVTVEADVMAASADLVAAGKPAIKVVWRTQSEAQWVDDLTAGRVDALAGDSAAAAFEIPKPPYAGKSEVGGPALNPQPIGIAIRKDDAGTKAAVGAAIDAMYADGTLKAIVDRWGMTDALEMLE